MFTNTPDEKKKNSQKTECRIANQTFKKTNFEITLFDSPSPFFGKILVSSAWLHEETK